MHILYCDHISFTYTPVHRYVNGKCYEYCSSYGDQLYVITSVCMLQSLTPVYISVLQLSRDFTVLFACLHVS